MTELEDREIRIAAKDLDKDTILTICLRIMLISKKESNEEFRAFLDSQTIPAQKFVFKLMMLRAFNL